MSLISKLTPFESESCLQPFALLFPFRHPLLPSGINPVWKLVGRVVGLGCFKKNLNGLLVKKNLFIKNFDLPFFSHLKEFMFIQICLFLENHQFHFDSFLMSYFFTLLYNIILIYYFKISWTPLWLPPQILGVVTPQPPGLTPILVLAYSYPTSLSLFRYPFSLSLPSLHFHCDVISNACNSQKPNIMFFITKYNEKWKCSL